jgi:hypothetical protein
MLSLPTEEQSSGWFLIVSLADFRDLKQHELREIQQIVEQNEEVFTDAWKKHFSA